MQTKDSVQIGRELRAWMVAQKLTEEELARKISTSQEGVAVTQSWISRLCSGDFKRVGGKTGHVLRYAGIRVKLYIDRDARGRRVLADAIEEVWDGTLPSAQALAGVLRSARAVARAARK